MAQKVQVLLLDDLTGGDADETITFALDGVTYEIDLTTANADTMRELLNPYAENGRRLGGRVKKGQTAPTRRTQVGPDPAAVRAWAASNGLDVAPRGRIPGAVTEAFEASEKGNKGPLLALQEDRQPKAAGEAAPVAEQPAAAEEDAPEPAAAPAKKPRARKTAAKKTAAAE